MGIYQRQLPKCINMTVKKISEKVSKNIFKCERCKGKSDETENLWNYANIELRKKNTN